MMNSNKILEKYTLKVFNHGDPGLEKSDIVSEEWTKMKDILCELVVEWQQQELTEEETWKLQEV